MNEKAYQNVLLMMIFVGGFFISFTVAAFIVFARFLDREKLRAERFRAEHDVPKTD